VRVRIRLASGCVPGDEVDVLKVDVEEFPQVLSLHLAMVRGGRQWSSADVC